MKNFYIFLLLFCASLSAQNYQLNKLVIIPITIANVSVWTNGVPIYYNYKYPTTVSDWVVTAQDPYGYAVPNAQLPAGLSVVISSGNIYVQGTTTAYAPLRQYKLTYIGTQCISGPTVTTMGTTVNRPSNVILSGCTPVFSVGTAPSAVDNVNGIQLSIYPNPVSNMLTVISGENINNITLFNSNGREVLNINPNDLYIKLNLTDMPAGIYLLRIKTISGTINKTVVKQ